MIFWAVFQKYPELIIVENELSYSQLNKIFAIIQMNLDYEKAKIQYDNKLMELKRKGLGV